MYAIEFENVGKQYRLGTVSSGTISHDLNRWWAVNVMHKEDPYLKIGETNDRAHKGESEYVWALKDINFKVEEGDVVGIIGKNGAGKSTLLKLLSRVTAPTTGKITAYGRIASLLEVGTGFHPEMTGRENIYMNGAIMGMTKAEITRKLDEIIDFSGCERYIDTPVKRYSSGMTVRLGFAIAAHLEPDILVVDEVLAVGDAEFQKKAIGKMQDISHGGGRTVLFVSHNMQSIKMLCKTGILLNNGAIEKTGDIEECVDYYLFHNKRQKRIAHRVITADDKEKFDLLNNQLEFEEVWMLNENIDEIATDEPLLFKFRIKNNTKALPCFQICIIFIDSSDTRVSFFMSNIIQAKESLTCIELEASVLKHSLPKGQYRVRLELNLQNFNTGSIHYDFIPNALSFNVKYIHKELQDEYLFWNSNFTKTLHLGNEMVIKLL